MRVKTSLRTILTCALLQVGVLFGMPVRVEEVEELLRAMNQPKVAHTEDQDASKDDK
jgi:hypothetical protein